MSVIERTAAFLGFVAGAAIVQTQTSDTLSTASDRIPENLVWRDRLGHHRRDRPIAFGAELVVLRCRSKSRSNISGRLALLPCRP